MASSGQPGHGEPAPASTHPGPPPARRGLGAVGRTLLLAVGLVAAFFVGLAAMALLGGTGDETAELPSTTPDEAASAPSLTGGDTPDELPIVELDGFGGDEPVDIADYRGAPLLVNFWATWCPPCVEEMPDLQQVHAELEGQVAFLGVNVSDAPSNAEAFIEELGVDYDLAVDRDGGYYRRVGSVGMPTTLAVDGDGRIVAHHTGPLTADELRELIAEHLEG